MNLINLTNKNSIMISETYKEGNRTIQVDNEEFNIFYSILINDINNKFYGCIDANIEKQDNLFYCIVVDYEDMKEKEFNTIAEAKNWVNKQLTKLENYYKNL